MNSWTTLRSLARGAWLVASALFTAACTEGGAHGPHGGLDSGAPPDVSGPDSGVDAGSETDGGPGSQTFTIRFRAMVGDEVASCAAAYEGFGPSGDQTIRLKDFRFYVHGVELLREGGEAEPLAIADATPWQRAGVALLDFEDATSGCANGTPETRDVVVGTTVAGDYVGVRFVLGVPFDQNHQDRSTALPPLSLSALFWSWQGGYKFLRADAETIPSAEGELPATFNVHVGSTGCDGSPATGGTTSCAAPNRPTIELEGFDPDASVVEIDFAAIVGAADLTFNTASTGLGCMSAPTDPECEEVLPSLGIPFGGLEPAMDAFRVGSAGL